MTDDSLTNFYTLKKTKRYLSNVTDQQVKYTGMPIQQHILICGSTGSGKTNCLLNLVAKSSIGDKPQYTKMYLVYKTHEPLYQMLEDELGDALVLCRGGVNNEAFPDVDEFKDNDKKNQEQTLVVLDDCIADTDKKSTNKIQRYYTYARKKGITLVYLSQSYFATPIFLRKNSSWVILCGIRGTRDLRAILSNYQMDEDTFHLEVMQKMYTYCKTKKSETDIPFMKLCTYECPTNKKISRNFLEYLNPNDFAKTKGSFAKTKTETETETKTETGKETKTGNDEQTQTEGGLCQTTGSLLQIRHTFH